MAIILNDRSGRALSTNQALSSNCSMVTAECGGHPDGITIRLRSSTVVAFTMGISHTSRPLSSPFSRGKHAWGCSRNRRIAIGVPDDAWPRTLSEQLPLSALAGSPVVSGPSVPFLLRAFPPSLLISAFYFALRRRMGQVLKAKGINSTAFHMPELPQPRMGFNAQFHPPRMLAGNKSLPRFPGRSCLRSRRWRHWERSSASGIRDRSWSRRRASPGSA